jgi:photosystem II stability/assembly factor-like uncharacterized protein
MKHKVILFLMLFLFNFSNSQKKELDIRDFINFSDLPKITPETPSWALPFYNDLAKINVTQMKKEIDIWVKSEDAKKYSQEILEKEGERDFNNVNENKLKESISEIPIVRFALYFFSRIPDNWVDMNGNINIILENNSTSNSEQVLSKNNLNSWTQIGPTESVDANGVSYPYQSNVYYISVSPSSPNVWLASTETGALFKTINNGDNWTFLGDYFGPVEFNPLNSNNIIIGSNPLRESNDGGLTWENKSVTTSCNKVVWSSNGNVIIVATVQGVFVSNDGGTTFTNYLVGNFYDVEFKPGSSTVAYAIDINGNFFKTTNGGINWLQKTTTYSSSTSKDGFLLGVSAADSNIVSIAFLTGTMVELLKSSNSGETFTALPTLNSGFSQGFYDFAFGISPTNSNIYYVGVTTLYKSTDGGLNFTAIGGYQGSYKIHPDIQDIDFYGNSVVVSTDGGVSVSSDNFTDISNWHSASNGLFDLELWAFDQGFNTDQMGGGKYHNGDNIYNPKWNNGKTINLGGAEAPVGYSIFSRPNSLFFDDIYDGFYLADEQYNPNVTRTHAFSLKTNDFFYGQRNSDITSNVVYSNIIYAGYQNSIYISYDNGITNQVLKTFNSKVWNVKTTRNNQNVIYVITEADGIWKTADGGLNWTQYNIVLNGINYNNSGLNCFIDVSQTNSSEIWLARVNWNGAYSSTSLRIFKSTNSGLTWQNIDTSLLSGFTVKEMAHQYGTSGGIYIIGFDSNNIAKCYYRNNSMTNWVDYSNGLLKGTIKDNRIYFKLSHYQEKIRAAGWRGIQEIPFYENYTTPIAQPTTNSNEICINQPVKLADYSIINYTGATWQWSFSKNAIYLNGTSSTSQNPEVKFLTPGGVNVSLTVTDIIGRNNTKTIDNFINVNYDSSSCLLLNSDPDGIINCTNNILQSAPILPSNTQLVTNFGGATSGEYIVKLNVITPCYNVVAQLTAIINLTTNKINVIQYNHFNNSSSGILGNTSNTITSVSSAYAKISFSLIGTTLYLNHINNACGTGVSITLQPSCWKIYSGFADNGDSVEIQKCNVAIPQSTNVNANTIIPVTNFNNATSGLFFVTINGYTNCNNSLNKIKAIVNLNSNTINVLEYKHFWQSTTSAVLGNETSSVTSSLNTNAQVNYSLINNTLTAKIISNTCGNGTFRINSSCWSAMDSDNNGVDNTLQPVTCNNIITSSPFTDSNTHIVKDFNSIFAQQNNVFVKLNIFSNCNNLNAIAYLNIDLVNNVINMINYNHFGSTTSSTILNNNSANVYSESSVTGKLKFLLINKVLYIQRLSTTCANSYYQIGNSCYSLASDEMLSINNYASNFLSNVIAYPNPTKGLFYIKTEDNTDNYSLNFFNIEGKYISSNYKKIDETQIEVNFEGYADGIYFAILYNKEKNTYHYLKIYKN